MPISSHQSYPGTGIERAGPKRKNWGIRRLREHMKRHNRWVLLLTVLTFVFSAILWAGLYFAVWCIFLLCGTAANPFDFRPAAGSLLGGFAAAALLLCFLAWLTHRLRPNAAPRDHKSIGEHFLDLLLAVPRLTLSIFGTGGAAARLTNAELRHAWNLLRRMDQIDAPLPVQILPVEIPDSAMRDKIILALQLSGLIEIRPTPTGPALAFQNKEARQLAQEKARLQL